MRACSMRIYIIILHALKLRFHGTNESVFTLLITFIDVLEDDRVIVTVDEARRDSWSVIDDDDDA